MKRSNWFRQIAPAIFLIGSLFFVSCSQEPAPGPISPINPADKLASAKSTPNPSTSGTVRPVTRLTVSDQSLAKSGYNIAKVQQELEAVCDELQAIVDNNPGWMVENKLDAVLYNAKDALARLRRIPADDRGALYRIDRAKDDLQEAISKWLLLPSQGAQFMNQLTVVEDQVADAINLSADCRGRSKYLWIKRSYGGLITFGGHRVKVPKYATRQDAQFSINISRNDYITVDFGPDGWFDQEVTVTISYKEANLIGIDPTKLTLAWYDESTNRWVDIGGTVDLLKKTVTAKTRHFTEYTISTR